MAIFEWALQRLSAPTNYPSGPLAPERRARCVPDEGVDTSIQRSLTDNRRFRLT